MCLCAVAGIGSFSNVSRNCLRTHIIRNFECKSMQIVSIMALDNAQRKRCSKILVASYPYLQQRTEQPVVVYVAVRLRIQYPSPNDPLYSQCSQKTNVQINRRVP